MEEKSTAIDRLIAVVGRLISGLILLLVLAVLVTNLVPYVLEARYSEVPEVALQMQTTVNASALNLVGEIWNVAKPAVQLLLILAVLIWAWQTAFKGRLGSLAFAWDTRTMIGVVLIGTFCLAILTGARNLDLLKDIILVVVGFYFGSREARPKKASNNTEDKEK